MKDNRSRSDIYLTATLIAVLLLKPVFEYYNSLGYFFGFYLLVLLASAYRDSHTSLVTRLPEVVTGVVALVCAWLHVLYPDAKGVLNLNLVAFSIFLFIHTVVMLRYGDVLPLNAFSQSLAIVLILVGQFYMAIVMALIIGKHLNGKMA